MEIAFLVNRIEKETASYATVKLALTATNRGHKVWFIGVDDLSYYMQEENVMCAKAITVSKDKYTSAEKYIEELQKIKKSDYEKLVLSKLDVLFLRNNPSEESANREWAKNVGIDFGRLLARDGVIVLNSPSGLSYARDKMYLESYPESIRPKTLITKDHTEIKEFLKEIKTAILKPLAGSKGKNVFLVNGESDQNMNQIIDAISTEGYIIVQEYLHKAKEGDIRLLMVNGEPLKYKGKYAAFKRVGSPGDVRNNVSAGGTVEKAEIDESIQKIVDVVRPRLIQDGMFFVGLDIVGDKILEINVFSPGGLGNAQKMEGVDFSIPVIEAIERKVGYLNDYNKRFNMHYLTTL